MIEFTADLTYRKKHTQSKPFKLKEITQDTNSDAQEGMDVSGIFE